MNRLIAKQFGKQKPRAFVLDDNPRARVSTTRHLLRRGFDVVPCNSGKQFWDVWSPGMADVIIADWDLSATDKGDEVLQHIRKVDWDVPFVLVSGKLDEHFRRVDVLANLLEEGSARFVQRGTAGIHRACNEAESLIERRDLALVKVILAFRPAALSGSVIQTSSGKKSAAKVLAEIVAEPRASHTAEGPIADHVNETITRSK